MSAVVIRKHLDAAVVKVEAARRHITFIASQEVVDRDGEVLLADGIDTTEFQRNPVLLGNHDHDFVFGRVTALRVEQRPGGKALIAEADVLPAGISARVDEAWGAIAFGARNAFSIGFLPVESSRDPVLPGQRGVTYLKVKLMEISSVSVPSCPTCLIEAKRWDGRPKSIGGDAVVLRLADDPAGDDVLDVSRLFRPETIAFIKATARLGDPLLVRQHVAGEPVFNVNPDALLAAMRTVMRDATKAAIDEQVALALRLARGRVD